MEDSSHPTTIGRSSFGLPFPDSLHSTLPVNSGQAEQLRQVTQRVHNYLAEPVLPRGVRELWQSGDQPAALQSSRTWFAQQGFLRLGLFERRANQRLPGEGAEHRSSVIDGHISAEGTVLGEYFHLRRARLPLVMKAVTATLTGDGRERDKALRHMRRVRHALRLSTEFDDGAYLVTTNEQRPLLLDLPPHWLQKDEPVDAPPPLLLTIHMARVRQYQQQHPRRRPVLLHDLDDLRTQAIRLWQAERKHRDTAGWLSATELSRMLNIPLAEAESMLQSQPQGHHTSGPVPLDRPDSPSQDTNSEHISLP